MLKLQIRCQGCGGIAIHDPDNYPETVVEDGDIFWAECPECYMSTGVSCIITQYTDEDGNLHTGEKERPK
jgi:hypothetical protein